MASTPTSLAMAVRIAGSSERSSARREGHPWGAARRSATASMASVAEPPLPSASTVPPPSVAARIAAAAAARPSPLSPSVWARSAAISPAFISTEALTSSTTASRSCSCSARKG